ncbi:MAG: matrixin family metalloprotease, partial [Candidatus Bathyarchaeota archaeon]|nr:matrixin family metalloprotease [Candidatus Bathyarchaeum sp.]
RLCNVKNGTHKFQVTQIVYVVANVRKLALTSILMILLGSTLVPLYACQTKAQADHYIEVMGYTRDHSTISISIFPMENESWWEPSYLDAALNGISQWNDAIQEFASNYTEFSYLSELSLVPTVTEEQTSGFDIYIGWIAECGNESTIGQTRSSIKYSCIIVNSTVCLAAKAPSGHVMNEVDMQNIVVHELGHNLGLSHCSYSGDAMHVIVEYTKTVKALSSLNMYAIAQNFEWLSNSTVFNLDRCPQASLITLPLNITYFYLPVAAQNLPEYSTQNLAEYTVELFLRPEILTAIFVAVTLIIAATVIIKRQKKPQ